MDSLNTSNHEYRVTPGNQAKVTAEAKSVTTRSDAAQPAVRQVTPSDPSVQPKGAGETNPATADQTVQKALEASGLPMSERNRSLVKELLQHKLPVDRNTLQTLARLAALNRSASVSALVLMYKNQIPITAANLRQFEAYQNGNHQLLKDIQSLTKNITELLKTLLTKESEASFTSLGTENGRAGEAFLTEGTATEAGKEPAPDGTAGQNSTVSNDAAGQSGSASDPLAGQNGALPNPVSGQNGGASDTLAGQNSAVLNPAAWNGTSPAAGTGSSANLPASGEEGLTELQAPQTGSGADSIHSLSHTGLAGSPEDKVPAYPGITGAPMTQQTSAAADMAGLVKEGASALTADALTAAKGNGQDQAITGQYMHGGGLMASQGLTPSSENTGTELQFTDLMPWLTDALAAATDTERNLESNTLLKEAMGETDLLRKLASLQEEGSLPELSPELLSKLERLLKNRWTLTPEELSEKTSLKDLYNKLEEDLNKLDGLLKLHRETKDILPSKEPIRNLQDNLQFMRALNELFPYIQLPVRFRDREVHGEFYVFSKKNALLGKKDMVSVLLHLDMTELGAMNIHMKLQQNQLQANFAFEKAEAGSIISEHLPELVDTLSRKGYQLQARVEKQEQPKELIRELLEQDSAGASYQVFSFDTKV